MGYSAADRPVNGFAGKKTVDETGGKAVASADAVKDVDIPLGHVDELVPAKRDCAPGVAAGRLRGTQGAGDELEVRVTGSHFAEHGFISVYRQFGEVVGDAFDMDAEHGREVFLVAEKKIDLADQFAVHFLGLGVAADGFPERIAEVEVKRDRGTVASGGVHCFSGNRGGGGGQSGEDAAGVEPAGAILLAEDGFPFEIA